MVSSRVNDTGARVRVVALWLAAFTVMPWAVASAHDVRPSINREIVRIQGLRASQLGQTPGARTVTILAAGTESMFAINEWQVFGVEEAPGAPTAAEHARYVLQGAPEVLSRFSAARPTQRVTILAERRPGGSDLFVLALDLCPPD